MYSNAWTYHSLFNHSPVERYLRCFQFKAITNKFYRNIHKEALYKHQPSFIWVKWKDCNCWKTEYLFFYEMCILFCGIAMYDRSIFLYHYQHLVLLLFFILAILICCRLCYCGLIWIFLMANNMELFINFFSLHTLLN